MGNLDLAKIISTELFGETKNLLEIKKVLDENIKPTFLPGDTVWFFHNEKLREDTIQKIRQRPDEKGVSDIVAVCTRLDIYIRLSDIHHTAIGAIRAEQSRLHARQVGLNRLLNEKLNEEKGE